MRNRQPASETHDHIGVPRDGLYRERPNSAAASSGGSKVGNGGALWAEPVPQDGFAHSIPLSPPPLGALVLQPEGDR
jgi:1,4-alpha-glucan branching enzyme